MKIKLKIKLKLEDGKEKLINDKESDPMCNRQEYIHICHKVC